MNITPLLLATAVAIPFAAPAAAQASVVQCASYSDYPNVMISSARNMTCAGATSIMKAYKGDIARTFSAPRSFRCTRVSGSTYAGQWRCTRRGRAFRFEFKD
jgi:hypothetical protein